MKTFAEITNPKKWVRVIDSTYHPSEYTRAMVGGEYEVRSERHEIVSVLPRTTDKSNHWWFNRSDVVFLTPVEFEGKRIGIGDEVLMGGDWYKVYGYYWIDGEWELNVVDDKGDFGSGCDMLGANHITAHRPLTRKQTDLTDAELIAEAERRGLLKEGKVLR